MIGAVPGHHRWSCTGLTDPVDDPSRPTVAHHGVYHHLVVSRLALMRIQVWPHCQPPVLCSTS